MEWQSNIRASPDDRIDLHSAQQRQHTRMPMSVPQHPGSSTRRPGLHRASGSPASRGARIVHTLDDGAIASVATVATATPCGCSGRRMCALFAACMCLPEGRRHQSQCGRADHTGCRPTTHWAGCGLGRAIDCGKLGKFAATGTGIVI